MIPYIHVPDLHIGPIPLPPFGLLVATRVLVGIAARLDVWARRLLDRARPLGGARDRRHAPRCGTSPARGRWAHHAIRVHRVHSRPRPAVRPRASGASLHHCPCRVLCADLEKTSPHRHVCHRFGACVCAGALRDGLPSYPGERRGRYTLRGTHARAIWLYGSFSLRSCHALLRTAVRPARVRCAPTVAGSSRAWTRSGRRSYALVRFSLGTSATPEDPPPAPGWSPAEEPRAHGRLGGPPRARGSL